MSGATRVSLQLQQVLRLPRKMTLMINPLHTWNAIYNARSNKCHCPNSPNTAPATKNESHDWSLSHMKRYLQWAEQQESASNFSKYCACHEKWLSWLILVTHETLFTMRGVTSVIVQTHQILRLPRKMTLMIDPCHTWNAIYNARSNKCHCPNSRNIAPATKNESQRGATSVIVQTHQILRLPRKMNLMLDPCHTWNAIYNARSNKCHCPNSPNTAPATKNESHDWSLSHMKRYLQCAEQQVSLSKRTKYCACHEKWISWLILVTHETLFTMRGATRVIVQTHRIVRLPRKMTLQNFRQISRKQLKRQFQCGTDPSRIRAGNRHSATRLATEVTFHAHHEHFVLKNTTFRAPAIIPNITEYCACHEKWHFNFTKYCACHEKWVSWLILVTHETLFTMRGLTSVIVQTHQILRLPRKMNLMLDPCHTWNAIYNARSNKCHCPNSPNTAPATKNESHDWSLSHMKRYLQCAEQQVSLSKLTE